MKQTKKTVARPQPKIASMNDSMGAAAQWNIIDECMLVGRSAGVKVAPWSAARQPIRWIGMLVVDRRIATRHAETHRSSQNPAHRVRSHHYRSGVRVRL